MSYVPKNIIAVPTGQFATMAAAATYANATATVASPLVILGMPGTETQPCAITNDAVRVAYLTQQAREPLFAQDFMGAGPPSGVFAITQSRADATLYGIVTTYGPGVYHISTDAVNPAERIYLDTSVKLWANVAYGLIYETRFLIKAALPPTAGNLMVIGLTSDYNADPANWTKCAYVRVNGNDGGRVYCRTDDNTAHNTGELDSGVVVVADTWYTLQIDCTTAASVKFYLDGTRLLAATVFDMSDAAGVHWMEPIFFLNESAATEGPMDLYIDYVKAWQSRQ